MLIEKTAIFKVGHFFSIAVFILFLLSCSDTVENKWTLKPLDGWQGVWLADTLIEGEHFTGNFEILMMDDKSFAYEIVIHVNSVIHYQEAGTFSDNQAEPYTMTRQLDYQKKWDNSSQSLKEVLPLPNGGIQSLTLQTETTFRFWCFWETYHPNIIFEKQLN